MDHHKQILDRLCRICGQNVQRYKTKYISTKHTTKLSLVGIDPSMDNPVVHPAYFCHGCYTTLARKEAASKTGKVFSTTLAVCSWEIHYDNGICKTCKKIEEIKRGGRRKKLSTFSGRPITNKLTTYIRDIAPPSYRPPKCNLQYLMPSSVAAYFTLNDLECSLCHDVLDRPVHLPCNQTVCSECLCTQLAEQRKLECPCCGVVMHDKEHITPASSLIIKVLTNLTVQCEECQQFVKASQLEEHLRSSCQSSTIAVSPTNVSVQDLLSRPSSSSLSPVEQQLGRNLVERMESDGILQVQTRGQVHVLNSNDNQPLWVTLHVL